MLEPERLERILDFLREKHAATVQALANRLYISQTTVPRDLNELGNRGLVKRVHGGAVLVEGGCP